MKPIIDKKAVYDEEGKIFFEYHFKTEITPDEVKRNKAFLKSNLMRIQQELKLLDFEMIWKNELKSLENDLAIKKEALKNYDKYVTDRILEIKQDRNKNKLSIQQHINNFDKKLESLKQNCKNRVEGQKGPLLRQMEHDEEQLNIYTKYENKTIKTEE